MTALYGQIARRASRPASAPDRRSQVRTGLPAGGKWIRTIGPAVKVSATRTSRIGFRTARVASDDWPHSRKPALGVPVAGQDQAYSLQARCGRPGRGRSVKLARR